MGVAGCQPACSVAAAPADDVCPGGNYKQAPCVPAGSATASAVCLEALRFDVLCTEAFDKRPRPVPVPEVGNLSTLVIADGRMCLSPRF